MPEKRFYLDPSSTPAMRYPLYIAASLMMWVLLSCDRGGQSQAGALHSIRTVLGSDAPYLFPEKLVIGPNGDLYILDTGLSNVFLIQQRNSIVSRLCEPKAPVSVSDMTVDTQGNIWILDSSQSRVIKLSSRCEVQASFGLHNTPLRLQVNTFGELLVLTGEGEALFELYSADGNLLRSFGQRFRYGNAIADSELSAGRIISDSVGGVYFSFNYPPLIRHYSRQGNLLGEFTPESDVKLEPPDVSSSQQGTQVTVSSRYQILVLDMALDTHGRLHLLVSGKNKSEALTEGSRKLVVTTNKGQVVGRFDVQESSFHRLGAGEEVLYLLKNKKPNRLEMYTLP